MRLPALVSALCLAAALRAAESYPPHPDSQVQPGVPVGEIIKFTFADSKIFPGTTREVTVYVPRQYDGSKPACVYVNQDGVQWNAPVVFDNLIAKKEMPLTIGVFVGPGIVKAATPATALDRFNRSYEYDSLGGAYAAFLLQELLPAVKDQRLPSGRIIELSSSGNDRAIGGASSGAIAAFTAAWERPGDFTRVFSAIGTYVGLRGGNIYPTLIRKTEPKPLRVFLQDGSADQNIYGGDWWLANQEMERALTYAGYEVNHAWGEGGHNSAHGTAIFPDAMRWLWKDWPTPVKAAPLKTDRLGPILIPGEGWEKVPGVSAWAYLDPMAANTQGEVFYNWASGLRSSSLTQKVGLDGKANGIEYGVFTSEVMAFGPDGRRFTVSITDPKVRVYDSAGKATVLAEGFNGNQIIVAHNGNAYITSPPDNRPNPPAAGTYPLSRIWLVKPDGTKQLLETNWPTEMGGIALSPDQSLFYVADRREPWVYSYSIQPDGTLANRQRFFWLHSTDSYDGNGASESGVRGIAVDRNGNLYAATKLGIQICDPAGRVNAILPWPNNQFIGLGDSPNLVFGGPNFDTLYVGSMINLYRRKLNTKGANAWDTPTKPVAPRL
jgi:gluconolactonase